jgi:hypothetical protein
LLGGTEKNHKEPQTSQYRLGCDTLKMEAAMFSEVLALYHNTTWHCNPDDLDLNLHHLENISHNLSQDSGSLV